jgi:hypothetical protein
MRPSERYAESHSMTSPRWVSVLVVLLVWSATPAFGSREATTATLQLVRTIRTTPFVNSAVSMKDAEGSAYVPSDDSLWLAEDNGRSAYEINPTSGHLKRVIRGARFGAAKRFGGGPVAGPDRTRDLESMAYDAANDALYVFSGSCCSSASLPAVYRLVRNPAGNFRLGSYQPLPAGTNYIGSAWNPADQQLYVGAGKQLRTYDFDSNTSGPIFNVPGLGRITGMDFSADGADLFVTTSAERLRRVDWGTKTLVSGWTFNLLPFDVRDSRAVELINGQFYVLDGSDTRPSADPHRYAVFVFSA